MNFKHIVWFMKAISYFALLRSLGITKIIFNEGTQLATAVISGTLKK